MQRRIDVSQAEAFPCPLFMVGDMQPARDFARSTRDQFVQAVDEAIGVGVWAEVIDSPAQEQRSGDAGRILVGLAGQVVVLVGCGLGR